MGGLPQYYTCSKHQLSYAQINYVLITIPNISAATGHLYTAPSDNYQVSGRLCGLSLFLDLLNNNFAEQTTRKTINRK